MATLSRIAEASWHATASEVRRREERRGEESRPQLLYSKRGPNAGGLGISCRLSLVAGYLEAREFLVDPFSRMDAKVDESRSRVKLAFRL
eukprot:6541406-Pyramimonas_sp.AAC.1